MKYGLYLCSFLIPALLPGISSAICINTTSTSQLSQAARDAGYTVTKATNIGSSFNQRDLGIPQRLRFSSLTYADGRVLYSGGNASYPSASGGLAPNDVIYRCDAADLGSIFEYYAFGDARSSSAICSREVPEAAGAYYTEIRNLAYRATNLKSGEYFTPYWKRRAIPAEDVFNDGTYIYVPANAFSGISVDLIKAGAISGTSWAGIYSHGGVPIGYVVFQGPGYHSTLDPGNNSCRSVDYASIVPVASWLDAKFITWGHGGCRVKDYSPVVNIPPILAQDLAAGTTSQAIFSVSAECNGDESWASMMGGSTVIMGFMVNNTQAAAKASALGLTTAEGAYTWLLNNNYGANGVSSGTGIRIYNSSSQPINLLSGPVVGTGENGGWYLLKNLLSSDDGYDSMTVLNNFSGNFIASLEAIPGQTVKPGTVEAQLQIIMELQ